MDGIDIALGLDGHALPENAGNNIAQAECNRGNAVVALESSRLLKENLWKELTVCQQAADKYPSNYYAWTHRAWIVRYCFNCSLQVITFTKMNNFCGRTWQYKC